MPVRTGVAEASPRAQKERPAMLEAGYTAAAGELFPYAASSVFESAR